MVRRIPAPLLPTKLHDPTGLDAAERRAIAEFRRRLKAVADRVIAIMDRLTYTTYVTNAVRYTYDLRPELLDFMLGEIGESVDDLLLGDTSNMSTWFFDAYVSPAYVRGTAQAFSNLAHQSPTYRAGARSVRDILQLPQFRTRIGLLRGRVFEQMKGLAGDVKASMSRVLTDGLARGKGPRDVARTLRTEAGLSAARAERIARTEMNTALKRARLDEADDAAEQYGLVTKQMHVSALSPTTRRTHAARSGNLYTTDEIRDWYSHSGNSINCKCTQVEVIVGDDGQPLVPTIAKRVKAARDNFESEHGSLDDE